jgi:hypothetical protein
MPKSRLVVANQTLRNEDKLAKRSFDMKKKLAVFFLVSVLSIIFASMAFGQTALRRLIKHSATRVNLQRSSS